jgi:hypothetical protein
MLIILISFFLSLFYNGFVVTNGNVEGVSSWVQETENEFLNGTFNNLNLTSNHSHTELKLSDTIRYTWINNTPEFTPTGRFGFSISSVYGTDKVVIFGGLDSDFNKLNDTWIYDISESVWTEAQLNNSPPPMYYHDMASIWGTDKILLLTDTCNTWIYDLSENTWSNQNLGLEQRWHFALASVHGDDKVVLFGGIYRGPASRCGGAQDYFNDTWIFDLSEKSWKLMNPVTQPYEREGHSMIGIPGTDKVIMFGGYVLYSDCRNKIGYPGEEPSSCFIYDISDDNWTAANVPFKGKAEATFIDQTKEILVIGGIYFNETWIYNYTNNVWTKINSNSYLNSLYYLRMVSIQGTNSALIFGGAILDGIWHYLSETWIFTSRSNYKNGTYISTPYNFGKKANLLNLSWNSSISPDTDIKFQLRSASKLEELSLKRFLGPNGKQDTFYSMSPSEIWSGHNNDSWIQYIAYFESKLINKTPILRSINIIYNFKPKLENPTVKVEIINDIRNFNFTIKYVDQDNDKPMYANLEINGNNYTLKEQAKSDKIYSEGIIYWRCFKLKAGDYSYRFFTSDEYSNFSTKLTPLKIDRRPIVNIKIVPSTINITTDDIQQFKCYGYDLDKNNISIDPIFEITGGGVINKTGNFIASTVGNWTLYANYSGVSGSTKINILPGALNKIIITPQNHEMEINQSQIFSALGYDSDENFVKITPTWSTNGGGKIDQYGNYTSKKTGNWTIYANCSNISGYTDVKVIGNETILDYDIDNDKIPDIWEQKYGLNSTNASDAKMDYDNDNLTNFEEYLNRTNPYNPDSDGDGYNDGFEIKNGSNPLDKNDFPLIKKEKSKNNKPEDSLYRIYYISIGLVTVIFLLILAFHLKNKYKKDK